MRDFMLDALLALCLIALTCLFVAFFNARIQMLEYWCGDEHVERHRGQRLAFIGSTWFFFAAGGTFVATAMILMFLLN